MKLLKLSVLAIMMLGGISSVKAQNADDILKKHVEAIGGADKWDNIHTMKMVGGMNMGGMDIGMTQTLVTDKGMRMDISAMGMNGYTIMTPKEGWMYMPFQPGMDKVVPIPEAQIKASRSKLNMKTSYLADRSKIQAAEYLGRDTIQKAPCYKLKIKDVDGNEQTAYIDASTYYLIRSEMTVKIKDEEQEIGITYGDFKKLPEGLVVPMLISSAQGDVTFKSIEINKPVDESIFKPTAAATEKDGANKN